MSSTDIINVKVILSNLSNDINEFELDFDFLELSYAIRARVKLLKLKQSFVLMKRCILRCLLNESENINLRGAFWLVVLEIAPTIAHISYSNIGHVSNEESTSAKFDNFVLPNFWEMTSFFQLVFIIFSVYFPRN